MLLNLSLRCFRLLQQISKMTLAKINQKINFPGESRTKEQEYRKATPFFPVCTGALPIIIQALNYFIQTCLYYRKCLTSISILMELN